MKNTKFLIAVFCLMIFVLVNITDAHVTINSDKTLNINGSKVFPTIMYYICDQWDESKEPCATSMARVRMNYTIDYWPAGSTAWWTDVHQPAIGGYPILVGWTAGRTAPAVLSSDARFFYYAGMDEPDVSTSQWTDQKNWYASRHAADPAHPVFMNVASGSNQVRAKDALTYSDALMLSNYPNLIKYMAPPRGTDTTGIYAGYGDMFYAMQSNSIKIIMQGHEASYFTKPIYQICWTMGAVAEGYFLLSEQEQRVCSWIGITMDFSGAAFYVYKRIGSNANVTLNMNDTALQMANRVAGEIRGLNDVLVLPTQHYQHYLHRDTYVSFDKELTSLYSNHATWGGTSKNLNYIYKMNGSTHYLIVANADNRPMTDVTITISGLSGLMTAKTLGTQTMGSSRAGRTLSVTNGKFLEPKIDGFAVHIYQICQGTCPASPTPTQSPAPSTNSITLKPGWNQISSPVAAGIDLATIEASCTILQYKGQKLWAWNATAQVWTNPTKVEPFKGYWIYTAYQCTVPLSGTPAIFTSLPLSVGWNKISAKGTFSAIQGTCANHITGNWLWNWDKATEKWSHPTTMQLDKGYWIKVGQNCVLGG